MPGIGAAIGAAFTAGGFFTTVGGRLLLSVAASVLLQATAPAQKTPGIRTTSTLTGGTNPISFILGRYATSGTRVCPPMSHGTAGKVPNAYFTEVIQVSDVPGCQLVQVVVNGELVSLGTPAHAEYGLPLTGQYAGFGWVKFYDGTQTTADPMLLSKYGSYPNRPWQSDMIGRGVCYAICTFRYNRKVWKTQPRLKFDLLGIPLYDPRADSTVGGSGAQRWSNKATWAATRNPMVLAYNVMRGITLDDGSVWGGLVPGADLPLGSFFAAMNECDLSVSDGASGTEPQFRAGYEVHGDDEPQDVLTELAKACSGQFADVGGLWKVRAGAIGTPVYSFTDADILTSRPQELNQFPSFEQSFNAVHASYPEPTAGWEPKEAPPLYNAGYEALDQNQRLPAVLSLPAVPFGAQVRRLKSAWLGEERRFRRHQNSLPPRAALIEPLDAIAWTSTVNGYVTKAFEVSEVVDDLMTAVQRVMLRERDPADYSYPALPAAPGTPPISIPAGTLDVPSFVANGIPLQDGASIQRRPAIELLWDGTDLDGVTGLEYEIRLAASGTVIGSGVVTDVASGRFVFSAGIIGGQTYEARARLIMPGVSANWSAWDSAIAPVIPGIALVDGILQSVNFSAGIAGWQIDESGNAEFNALVARNWLQVGAVSDRNYAQTNSTFVANVPQQNVLYLDIGQVTYADIINVAYLFSGRMTSLSEPVWLDLLMRLTPFGGSLGSFVTIASLQATTTGFAVYKTILTLYENAQKCELLLLNRNFRLAPMAVINAAALTVNRVAV